MFNNIKRKYCAEPDKRSCNRETLLIAIVSFIAGFSAGVLTTLVFN